MSDKRTVATDALETLGMIIGMAEKRDAIHLAVEPVTAGAQRLLPGQDIGIDKDGHASAYARPYLGIVDPFLKDAVQPGQRFWLIIYPRQIKSLRHVWSHPAFPDEPALADLKPATDELAKQKAEQRLRDWCDSADGVPYDTFVKTAVEGKDSREDSYGDYYGTHIDGEYFHVGGSDAHGEIPSWVWDDVELVTGRKVVGRPEYFSCSC
jgi:hypothetical protein